MSCKLFQRVFQKIVAVAGIISLLIIVVSQPAYASSRKSYYDYGPYYTKDQVLGTSFSSLEQLPIPQIPSNAMPREATGILPGNPLHPFELFVENVQLALTTDPLKKEEFRLNIASERLSEANTLIEQKHYDLAAETASDYKDAMETVSKNLETLAENKTAGVENLVAKVEIVSASHAVVAQSLTLSSPPAASSTWNTIASATEIAMDKAADVSNKPPIPEDLSNSIQELKEQGLITPEESDKLYGLKSRSDVRDELDKLATSGQFPIAEITKLDQAVATKYPENYQQTINTLQFAELRTYQTLPSPSNEIVEEIKKWKESDNKDLPPPSEIRPYLYTQRAEELSKDINFSDFTLDQQKEVAQFYPQAISENPTFTVSPTPSLTPSPTVSPAPDTSPTTISTTLPTPTPPSASLYITSQNGALPGDPTYFLKQFGEQFSLITTFDPSRRLELNMRYAEERLREANALSLDKNKTKQYEDTLKRYGQTLENASTDLKNFKGEDEDKKDLAEKLQFEVARHNVVLEKGLLPLPSEKSTVYKEVIEATENAMDRSADVLGKPVLPETLENRLQDLKAQGLILKEEVDQLNKADSREEVREKIRKLVEIGTFPPADAKKLDDGQALVSPKDYNQLIEVRKVEELQRLRSVQTEFAQTATLRQTNSSYVQRLGYLENSIDTSMIKPEDLAGREDLLKTYETLLGLSSKRPINGGQFGSDVIPGATPSVTPSITPPARSDAVLTTCPVGAIFKQFEGCVWEKNGKKLNDYDQYRCNSPREYWSFAASKCVAYNSSEGRKDDASPLCPVGYTWSWQTQDCQASTGGISPFSTPTPEPTPSSEKELAERSKTCPSGSSYKPPLGCVWDDNNKPVYDQNQYRCQRGEYFSFESFKCTSAPKEGEKLKDDAHPECQEPNTAWSWTDNKCVLLAEPVTPTTDLAKLSAPKPNFIAPDSPFSFLKRTVEGIQNATAFTESTKQEVRLSQARERFAEAYYLLEKKDEAGFKKSLAEYTSKMQQLYNDMPKIEKLSNDSKKALGEKLADYAVSDNLLLQKASVIASSDMATPINAAASMTLQGVDRAADLKGEPAVPENIKEKIESLPKDMISDEEKKKLLSIDNRIEARIKLGGLVSTGVLTQTDTVVFDKEIKEGDSTALIKLDELKKLDEISTLKVKQEETQKKVEKTEEIAKKLDEFQKTFEPGKDVPSEIRPYVRLTRIEEVAQTIRPDIVNLNDFSNRKDIQLAVATLKEEFKPTIESIKKLEDFRRNNPNKILPLELARIEALAVGLGVRTAAESCFLPTPPFPPNTPCPAPGAAIPIVSYSGASWSNSPFGNTAGNVSYGAGNITPTVDKDGKPLVYGQGPKSKSAGVCPNGYHWMYDSGGWCMSDSGSYSSSYTQSSYTPSSPGYTPYSPYYTAEGVPPATYGYQGQGTYSSFYPYSAPSYYGTAPTTYTTNPPAGTVPGTGPAPISSGQCPSGYHWMPPSSTQAGWCMADSNTYVPAGTATSETTPAGGYNCGSQPYDPVTKRCKDGACPGGYNWDGSKCVASSTPYYSPNLNQSSCGPGYYWDGKGCIPTYSGSGSGSSGGGYSTGSSYQYGCTPGYYWDGSKCVAGSYEGSGWSDTSARSQSWCQPPSGGCGSNSYWDYGSCYCRSSSGGSGPSPSNQCQGLSCGGGAWLDYSTCSCKYSGGSGTSSTGSPITCYPPSAGCPGGWYDYSTCSCKSSSYSTSSGGSSSCSPPSGGCGSGWWDSASCSCKQSSSQGCYNVSASSCGSGWYFDSSACTCRQSSTSSGSTSGGSSSGGSSSGSCPSGYHWMDNSWCMSDGGSSSGSSSTPTSPASTTTTTTAPATSTSTTTETQSSPAPAPTTSAPAESTAPAPAPASSEPAPATSTESSPAPAP